MFIGDAAKATGLSIKAIRFYERKGLIRNLERVGRYRIFTESDIEVLNLIREAKELGITLSRLQGVIRYKNSNVDWNQVNNFLEEVKVELQTQEKEIKKNIVKVQKCIDSIGNCPNVSSD